MNLRRFLAEAGTLLGLAVVCALVSNALAGRERKLALPGDYPNATTVSVRPDAPAPRLPETSPAVPAAPAPDVEPSRNASPAPGSSPRDAAPAATASTALPVPAAAPRDPGPAAELLGRFPAHRQPHAEIAGADAAWLHARGALFLDARRSREYADGHVAGARSFPVWESDVVKERVEALVAEGRDGALPVVLYCSGGDCEDSHMLAQMLFGAGFENLLVYRDGFPDWVRRGGRVAAGGAE
jgi:rhodanese-related sulfurtransferase